MLIGVGIVGKYPNGKIVNFKCCITGIATKLGWTVMGKFRSNLYTETNSVSSASFIISFILVKDHCTSELWKLDVLGITEC